MEEQRPKKITNLLNSIKGNLDEIRSNVQGINVAIKRIGSLPASKDVHMPGGDKLTEKPSTLLESLEVLELYSKGIHLDVMSARNDLDSLV